MDETSTPPVVSTQVTSKVSSGKTRESHSEKGSWIPRPVYVAVTFVLLLTIGWTAYNIIGRPSHSDDDAELAELDGFEGESSSLDAPDLTNLQVSRVPLNLDSPQPTTSSAWLIGTIEADESPIQILSPPQVEQAAAAAEGPRFR